MCLLFYRYPTREIKTGLLLIQHQKRDSPLFYLWQIEVNSVVRGLLGQLGHSGIVGKVQVSDGEIKNRWRGFHQGGGDGACVETKGQQRLMKVW